MPEGIILKGIGGFYYISTSEGVYECKARGILRKDNIVPLPGDRVCITVNDDTARTGTIIEILQRDSVLVRPASANVDQLAVVVSVKSPYPDLILLDKLLVTAEHKSIKALVCINKIDLDDNCSCSRIKERYHNCGYSLIALSSKTDTGFDILKKELIGRITVFAGQSGVGKSTILNRIMNSWVMKTGEVSGKIERGKHTTRHAELIELDCGGYVLDTPGFSSFELSDIESCELEQYFPEFCHYINKCRFTGCSHISEPGCSVREALQNGHVSEERYQRYIQLYSSLKSLEEMKYKK